MTTDLRYEIAPPPWRRGWERRCFECKEPATVLVQAHRDRRWCCDRHGRDVSALLCDRHGAASSSPIQPVRWRYWLAGKMIWRPYYWLTGYNRGLRKQEEVLREIFGREHCDWCTK